MPSDGKLERVPPSVEVADHLVANAEAHIALASRDIEDDPTWALQLSYDAARKAAAALLAIQGLRATTRGGHIAVIDAVRAQFNDRGGMEIFGRLHRLRRRRNATEYPDLDSPTVTDDDTTQALTPENLAPHVASFQRSTNTPPAVASLLGEARRTFIGAATCYDAPEEPVSRAARAHRSVSWNSSERARPSPIPSIRATPALRSRWRWPHDRRRPARALTGSQGPWFRDRLLPAASRPGPGPLGAWASILGRDERDDRAWPGPASKR